MRAYSKQWCRLNPERKKYHDRKNRLKQYGITIEQYEEMFRKQRGLCAICKKPEDKFRLAVDHNHITGKVRGLLCHNCNPAIGKFNHDVILLSRALKYLKKGHFQYREV